MPDAYYFALKLGDGEAAGFFEEVDGIGSEHGLGIQKYPLTSDNITLKRGVDSNHVPADTRARRRGHELAGLPANTDGAEPGAP